MNVGNIDLEVTDQSVTLRMRHVVQGHPGAVLSFGEVDTLIELLSKAKERRVAQPKVNGLVCARCGAPQLDTPSGATCMNGHGGETGEEPSIRYWHHPESGCAFMTEPGEPFPGDPLVEEVDQDVYETLKVRYAAPDEDDPFACLTDDQEPSDAPDPFDLL